MGGFLTLFRLPNWNRKKESLYHPHPLPLCQEENNELGQNEGDNKVEDEDLDGSEEESESDAENNDEVEAPPAITSGDWDATPLHAYYM